MIPKSDKPKVAATKSVSRRAQTEKMQHFSISQIKKEMDNVSYLSDDLIITVITRTNNSTRRMAASLEGFSAIIVMAGKATITIDEVEYTVTPNTLVFFNPGSIVRTKSATKDSQAYFLAFSKNFINDVQIDLSTSLPVYMRFGRSPLLPLEAQDVDQIRKLFQLIKTMLASDKKLYQNQIIRTLFTTVFYLITEINQRDTSRNHKRGRCEVIFDRFSLLLNQHNKQQRNVGFYAKELKITPKYLSAVVKEVSGKTAAKWIDESVIMEAKSMLQYSGKSIQEIAEELNFSTQSFFGKYFKQHTGISPSRYKRER